MERPLGQLDAGLGEPRDSLPDLDRSFEDRVLDPGDEADPLGLPGAHVAAGEHAVRGTRRAHRARKQDAQTPPARHTTDVDVASPEASRTPRANGSGSWRGRRARIE